MPQMRLDGALVEVAISRIFLSVEDAAMALGETEGEIRTRVRDGQLQNISSDERCRLDPEEVARCLEEKVGAGDLGKWAFARYALLLAG